MTDEQNEQEAPQAPQVRLKQAGEIDFAALHQNEMHAMQMFTEKFDFANPEPEEPERFATKDLGVEFWLIVITGIAAVVQAALRTGTKFMSLAEAAGWDPFMKWMDGGSAMIGVEGIIFTVGLVRARAAGRKKLAEDMEIDTTKELIAVGIALLISIVAGVAQGVEGSQYIPIEFQAFMDWATLAMLGAGSSVLAYFAGEMTGLVLVRADSIWKARMDAFKAEVAERRAKFQEEWAASDIHKALYLDVKGATKVASSAYNNAARGQNTAAPAPRTQKPRAAPVPRSNPQNDVRARIWAHMDTALEFVNGDVTRLPGPTDLKNDLGVAKGYASEMIKAWKIERGILISETHEPVNADQ